MDKREKYTERILSWGVFLILLATYWLTVPPTVSYWDCPEYVAGAWKLEIGHPPGNPTWMLVERVVTMLAPSGKYAALLVNLSSGVFMAFAGYFIVRIIFTASSWILEVLRPKRWQFLSRCVASVSGSLAFGWCDSAWYSAVEAEVYAMSMFMTALCVWIMVKWAFCHTQPMSTRYLVLLAYLFGLSVGVHQLNLLCIPALAIIWGIKRGVRKWWKVTLIIFLSLAVVGCILVGVMPSTIALAAKLELFAVNTCHLPFLSGVALYVILLGISLLVALTITAHSTNRGMLATAVFFPVFLSGIFIFSDNFAVGAAVSAIASLLLVRGHDFTPRRLNICMWMLAMLLTGYATYAIIPIRGDIASPANSSLPGNPFSFASYQAREQYGGAPLLYGSTPLSKNIVREEFTASGKPEYKRALLRRNHPIIVEKEARARINDPYRMLSHDDSVFNASALKTQGDAYVVRGYVMKPVLTPELNMWFPRITSRNPEDFDCFADWAGMDRDNMTKVAVTEAVDSLGRFVNKLNDKGEREPAESLRPTYAQSMRMLFTYQIGYMYFRYLFWNFMGRQNDFHSTGEVEHGNFITGIPTADNAMLGAEDALPSWLGKENKGRNVYYLLPFLLGLAGIIFLSIWGKRGHKTCLAIAMLFVMTGLAIVIYLNQSPGEPRERDYSFLGSYWAFALWIGFGALGIMRSTGKYAPLAAAVPIFTVIWMFLQNFDDHDRSGRYAASRISANVLNSLDRDAIIFVDGDNATFPLWYAKEVESVRPDVRVVNMAYLSMPQYVAALMQDWDGADAIPSRLLREDIIYGSLQFPKMKADATDSIAGAETMMRELAASTDKTCGYRRVWLKLTPHDSIPYPVNNLLKVAGGKNIDFRKLMIFNIISANGASPSPRPIYWHRSIRKPHYIGLDTLTSQSLFARRLQRTSPDQREKEYLRGLKSLQAPNDLSRDVYIDGAPATQISFHRAGLLMAARDMTRSGRITTAVRLAEAADSLMGNDRNTYGAVRDLDSLFLTKQEISLIFRELADSLDRRDNHTYDLQADRLKRRAGWFEKKDSLTAKEWAVYYRTLPEGLRLKISK